MKRGAGSVPDDLKVDKADVLYLPPLPRGLQTAPGKGRTCGTCYMGYFAPNSEQGGCFVVKGAVHKQSSCVLWNFTGSLPLHFKSGAELAEPLRRLEPFLTRVHRR